MKKTNTNISLSRFIKRKLKTKEKLPFKTNKVIYPKNSFLIKAGEVEKNLYFICSGLVQVSIIDKTGDEKIIVFGFPQQFCCSLSSLITKKPTEFTITCITDCVLEVITREELYSAMEHSILANRIMRYFFEQNHLTRLKKEKDTLTKSPLKRYNELFKTDPEIVKNLALTKIAQYLGIHPQSLSRLRKQ